MPGIGRSKENSRCPSPPAAARPGGDSSSSVFISASPAYCSRDGQAAPSRIRSQACTMLECPSSSSVGGYVVAPGMARLEAQYLPGPVDRQQRAQDYLGSASAIA